MDDSFSVLWIHMFSSLTAADLLQHCLPSHFSCTVIVVQELTWFSCMNLPSAVMDVPGSVLVICVEWRLCVKFYHIWPYQLSQEGLFLCSLLLQEHKLCPYKANPETAVDSEKKIERPRTSGADPGSA